MQQSRSTVPEKASRSRTLPLTGALALGAGLAAPATAYAAPITITNLGVTVTGPQGIFAFDLDGNSVDDFRLELIGTNAAIKSLIGVEPVIATDGSGLPPNARMLSAGSQVDASVFTNSSFLGSIYAPGNWSTVGAYGFLALRITEADGPHYGWLEITRGSLIVGRLGYQSDPNVAAQIPAAAVPEPATLALLATGAAGLIRLRRKKNAGSPTQQ